VWKKYKVMSVPVKFVLIATSIISASLFFYTTFSTIFTGGVGKNGSTVAVSLFSRFVMMPAAALVRR
jgi:hypothetical protein